MKKIYFILFIILSIKANAQIVNRFRDSTWFAKGVQFDSTINFKGLKVGTENDTFIMVCRADGNIYKVDKSNFIKNIEYLPLAGGTMYEGATINFPNGSKLSKGTINANLGGNNGIAFKCSIDYEMKWEAGRLYIMQQDGATIRQSLYNFNIVPTVNDDNLKGYTTGSLWTLDNGDTYECTDPTTASAVWVQKTVIYQTALDDSITAVRNIRKVDTLYKNLDSILFTINGLQYSISDSVGASDSTVFATKDYVNSLNASNATSTALKDTANVLRNIRKMDSSYQAINTGRDSMVFYKVINGTTYRTALRDSVRPPQTLSLSYSDSISLSISSGNSIKFSYAVDSVSFITDSLIVIKGGLRKSYVKNTVTFLKNSTKDSSVLTINNNRYAVKDSVRPLQTFTFAKNTAKDSIIATFDGVRSAVKDSVGGGGSSGWSLTGNSATDSTANFIGTTDAKPLMFYTNNTNVGKFDIAGKLGIGTTAPLSALHVNVAKLSLTNAFTLSPNPSNLKLNTSFDMVDSSIYIGLNSYFSGTSWKAAQPVASYIRQSSTALIFSISSGNTINGNYTNSASTKALTLFSTGNITAGGATDWGYRFNVNTTVNGFDGMLIQNSNGGTSNKGGIIFYNANGNLSTLIYKAGSAFATTADQNALILETNETNGVKVNSAGATSTIRLWQNNIERMRVDNAGSVNIGGATNNNTTAIFEIVSTTKGLLPPRMTTTQINAIASPAEGLVVYNLTINAPCFYDGTGWRKITHSNM